MIWFRIESYLSARVEKVAAVVVDLVTNSTQSELHKLNYHKDR